ncbi:PAS domain-containing hybrid sensor histidine kinase/response regulator [Rubrivivax gelatinosus]|uniref:PAS domain-containing hybrid sensor histidine kinase/response regulator n=1 Tax=Rubrivivax gelatinosus TaxID=28068 RepID=UPI001F5B9150|nr:ATP-binding protein [Rubrivivax gelatinosus]
MPMEGPGSHDLSLLEFLYRAPVAMLQTDGDGQVQLMTPRAAQLLLPLAPNSALENLFDVLEPTLPTLRAEVAAFDAPRGTVLEGRRVTLRLPGMPAREQVLALGLLKLDDDRLVAWLVDVTSDEHERLALAEHLALATEAAGIGTFELRYDGSEPLHFNVQTFRLFGHPDGGSPQQIVREAVASAEIARLAAWVAPLRDGREADSVEFEIRLPDGQSRWLAAKGRLSQGCPAPGRSVVGVIWDITEQRRAQAALEAQRVAERASRAKSEFLSRLGHEIRTPLNAIVGFAQMLQRGAVVPLAAEHRQAVAHIADAGRHLERLIADLTDLSLIETGTVRLDSAAVDLGALIDEVLHEADAPAAARQVTLRRALPEGRLQVLADRTRLRQVLANLVSNAIKYNRPDGDVVVEVRRDVASWRIAVGDTGLGMSQAQQKSLFEPFNRLGRESSGIPGTGIGLVLTRELVEAMGGTLEVRSEPGCGSEFGFALPAAASQAPPPAPPRALQSRDDLRGRVLAVEDNPVNAVLLQSFFNWRPGVELSIAGSAAEALELARRSAPDLLLLDLFLPDRPGLELLREMRERDGLAMPCIVISASALPSDIEAARNAGVDLYLTKPLDVDRLLHAIDTLLGTVA